ncbi:MULTISPECIES: hypothetical protein [unclassified Rathayibacter]|uniref:hypothetical protein n=1 Tax=unclassified Rathayibacter TaxID=2609250 RepID=UPI000FB56582|nr:MULTISPECIES: hypothetical protein [unclassified Rathayibacter]ROP57406.1 hypothetical protein EDF45_0941 [Rathayibacter sp. PhB186]ROS55791.1 hypothetical protein EDF44_0941 [Rathayibacter sp. PhB185]
MNKVSKTILAIDCICACAIGCAPAAEAGSPGYPTTAKDNLVFVNTDPRGYQAKYIKNSGPSEVMDFNLACSNGKWFGSEGALTATATNTYTYVFAVGGQGPCEVQIKKLATGQVWTTGYVG